jgi:predicted nucleic acid-binding Zn ribbon protein
MAFKTIDDIEREKHKEERGRMRKDISEDINEVISNINILKKPKKEKRGFLTWILLIIALLVLAVVLINFILGNIWLLKFFIKNLFGM